MTYEWFGFIVVFVLGSLFAGAISYGVPRSIGKLFIGAFLLRVLGSLARHWTLYNFYHGVGDATGYYQTGVRYAGLIWNFNFSFLDPIKQQGGRWWGTQMVMNISGFVLSLIGPTMRGEFLFFSILSLFGIFLFCKTFEKNYPHVNLRRYALWVLFWPSLVYWPSAVGKDALIFLSTALVVYGYAGKGNSVQWISLGVGLGLASVIRPHVAGVMMVSIVLAHWVSAGKRWNIKHSIQGVMIILLAFFVLRSGLSNLGLEDVDLEGIADFAESISSHSSEGGSAIQAPGVGISSIPFAVLNMLFRPFLWEVGSVQSLAASLELVVFWWAVWRRRRVILRLAGQWRQNRMLVVSVPLCILYILMLGMVVGNLGIIARQRIHIMPLLFIWLAAVPEGAVQQKRTKAPQKMLRVARAVPLTGIRRAGA